MTGEILRTTGTGGVIVGDDGKRAAFQWRDVKGFNRFDSGHQTRVEYTPLVRSGNLIARHVRREQVIQPEENKCSR